MQLQIFAMAAVVLVAAGIARSQQNEPASKPADILSLGDGDKPADKADPTAVLAEALKDPRLAPPTLMALRAAGIISVGIKKPVGGDDLLVLFEAYSRSGDRQMRLLATTTMGQSYGKVAKGALLERLKEDTAMVVRSEALIYLLNMGEVTDKQLLAAIKLDDQSIQCISAKSLLHRGRTQEALPVLQKLTQSRDLATACLSRLSLLANGDESQRKPLLAVARDRATPEEVLDLMLQQIAEEKNRSGREIVRAVLEGENSQGLKLRAYRTLAATSPNGSDELVEAIWKTDELVIRVHLMRSLAAQRDYAAAMEKLASGDQKDIATMLAKLELARDSQDPARLRAALKQAISLGHPVVFDYILFDASEDLDGRSDPSAAMPASAASAPALRPAPAKMLEPYVAPMLEFINSVPTDPERMGRVHQRAAVAVTWLADSEIKEADAGLEKLVRGKYSAILRVAAAGLGKSRNQELVCRLSRALLESPYRDIKQDAALNLGRWGDKGALPLLEAIVKTPAEPPVLRALACWYCLKAKGTAAQAAKELAKEVK